MLFFRTMEGGLAEIHDVLHRMRDLAVRAANEATLTQADRDKLQQETASLSRQITQTAQSATFNTKNILNGNATAGEYRIAFESNISGNYEIYTMSSDGSDLQQVTSNGVSDGSASWSPDGSKIAYTVIILRAG